MRIFFLLFLIYNISNFIYAQDFLPSIPLQKTEASELQQLETAFDDWANQKDLHQEKGWKWYARWLEEQRIQANSDGNLSDQTHLFEAAKAKMLAQQNSVVKRSANWIPTGPNDYARIVTDYIIRGMGRINCITFHPTDRNTFWVGVAQGGIWKTTNGGESWMPLDNGLPILRISDIAINPNNTDELYASIGDYAYIGVALNLDDRKRHTHYGMGVYKSTNGGQSWQPTALTFDQQGKDNSLTRRIFVHHENGERLVAAGVFGIRISEDGGDTWKTTSSEVIRDIERHPTQPNILYAATATIRNLNIGNSAIWKSIDFGQTWQRLSTGIPDDQSVYRIELSISPSNPNYIYALTTGADGGMYALYRTTDAGENWEMRSNAPNVLHWYGGNGSGGQGTYDLTILVDPKNPDKIYTGGINLWGSEDGGLTWRMASYWVGSPSRKSIHADQHFLAYNPLDEMIYACNDGGVSRTKEIILGSANANQNLNSYSFQTDWEDIAGGMQITSFYRIGLSRSKPGEFIAGTQDNSSWLKKNGAWTGIIGGDGMEGLIHPTDPSILYGSSQYGNISKSVDAGESFFNISRNIPDDNRESAAWTTPFLLDNDEPEVLYVAYSNLYKSENGGATFTPISEFPVPFSQPTSSFAVSPADNNYIYLAHRIVHSIGEPSKMWRTFDGGNTWKSVTAGLPDELFFTYVTADDDDPELVWVTVGGFSDGQKVFRSDDGGDTWQNISHDLPNVPVNCIVQDPNSPSNTVYIGTDIGVYYIQDGLQEWVLYSDDLPQVVVSELEILAKESKIYAATFGRGIWEGNTVFEAVNSDHTFSENLSINISPNPNDGHFQLQIEGLPNQQDCTIEIVDIMGRRLLESNVSAFDGHFNNLYELDLPYGLYFLRLTIGKERKVVRFIVE